MGNTFFKGLGDLYTPQTTGPIDNLQQLKVFPAHVLDICLDTNSPLYQTQRDLGKIRFRDIINEVNKPENTLLKEAYPLDRSIARYPYPGEEVLIFRAFGDTKTPSAPAVENIYFYTFIVSTLHNVTNNQYPFLGTDAVHIDPDNGFIDYDAAKTRFDKKTKDVNSYKDGSNKTKIYKQLQPQEGDFILQGRFGNSIRFGSTSPTAKGQTQWNGDGSTGVSGDGIMVLRVDRDFATDEKSMFTNENVDTDDAAIIMCTSQKVAISLACSKKLLSWRARYDLPDSGTKEAEGLLTNSKDTSQLWQKVVDTTKPLNSTYQKPSNGNGNPVPPISTSSNTTLDTTTSTP